MNPEPTNILPTYVENLNYMKVKYNSLINSDIVIREFIIFANHANYRAFLVFIDGMVDSQIINTSVLKPLMLNNGFKANTLNIKNFNLENYIYNHLIHQNNVKKIEKFTDVFSSINMGNTILFVESLNISFDIDAKGFNQRSISTPKNEIVVRGSQEAFVENIRTNTSMLRRLINNEDLIIENCSVGKISKTKIAVCYLYSIANNDLVAEVKFRINNLDIDYLTSSGQLEQLIQDKSSSLYPQLIATERPDKVATHLLEGRVAIIVNDTPYVLVAPRSFIRFFIIPRRCKL